MHSAADSSISNPGRCGRPGLCASRAARPSPASSTGAPCAPRFKAQLSKAAILGDLGNSITSLSGGTHPSRMAIVVRGRGTAPNRRGSLPGASSGGCDRCWRRHRRVHAGACSRGALGLPPLRSQQWAPGPTELRGLHGVCRCLGRGGGIALQGRRLCAHGHRGCHEIGRLLGHGRHELRDILLSSAGRRAQGGQGRPRLG